MIKAEDLRIGDLVRYGDKVITLTAVHANGSVCFADGKDQMYSEDVLLEPIPLTPEILEKNGCKKKEYGGETFYCIELNVFLELFVTFQNNCFSVGLFLIYDDDAIEYFPRNINYLHEYQQILCALGKDANLKI